ncbi:MAG: type IV pilus inner membrane component PilO [Planctomycetota bacterium]|jgi:type IV pilus assembly protein PilO
MDTKKEKTVLLVILVASALVALGAGGGVYYLQRKAKEVEAENAVLQSRVAQAQTKISKLPAMRAQRESAEARLVVAERILPSQEEIESLVDNLSEFALASGVIIEKAAPIRQGAFAGPRGVVKRFEEADFELKLQGDFFEFVEFINLLENYKRFIRVDGFSLKSGRTPEEALDISLKFATFTYNGTPAAKGGK